jgi:hypothetical protein
MYWVLTQQHIPTAMSSKNESLVQGVDDSRIERPTPAIELNPRVPKMLSDLIDQCVEVDPSKRPASMQSVVGTLEDVQDDLSSTDDEPSLDDTSVSENA